MVGKQTPNANPQFGVWLRAEESFRRRNSGWATEDLSGGRGEITLQGATTRPSHFETPGSANSTAVENSLWDSGQGHVGNTGSKDNYHRRGGKGVKIGDVAPMSVMGQCSGAEGLRSWA